ncbi:MAG: 1-acyl-sn-glycerol-3-phosphate acyltransferase [Chitinophagaceae bacterium]|nr:1-acyl-sn-glycerol-3-phosphate acyltransferase [Chitinophagaceae bacterium]
MLKVETPMVLGTNHPNSFLDAIIVGGLMSHRVHFITRSGVFKHPVARAILRSVNMIPVYRKSDGKGQLSNNDATFEEVRQILKRGEHVMIFVEGMCIHQTTLQTPLKKRSATYVTAGLGRWTRCKIITRMVALQFFRSVPQRDRC